MLSALSSPCMVRCLHGWTGSPNTYGRLRRTGQLRRQRNDGVRLYEINFACQLVNQIAVNPVKFVSAASIANRG